MPYIQYPSLGGSGSYLPSNAYLYYDSPVQTLHSYNLIVDNNLSVTGNGYITGALVVSSNSAFSHKVELETLFVTNPLASNAFVIEGTASNGHTLRSENGMSYISILGDNGSQPGAIKIFLDQQDPNHVTHSALLATDSGFKYEITDVATNKLTTISIRPNTEAALTSGDPIVLTSDISITAYTTTTSSPSLTVVANSNSMDKAFHVMDLSNNITMAIQGNGGIIVGQLQDTDADYYCIFHDTSTGTLSYKDGGGTVRTLY